MSEKPVVIQIPSIDTWPITTLRNACKRNKIKGYTRMDREQLIVVVKGILKSFNEGDKDERNEC